MKLKAGVYFVCGERGSGKTSVIQKLLHLWGNDYTEAFCLAHLDGNHLYSCTPRTSPIRDVETFWNGIIERFWNAIVQFPYEERMARKKNLQKTQKPTLLVLDDMYETIRTDAMRTVLENCKDYNVACLMSVQYSDKVPKYGESSFFFCGSVPIGIRSDEVRQLVEQQRKQNDTTPLFFSDSHPVSIFEPLRLVKPYGDYEPEHAVEWKKVTGIVTGMIKPLLAIIEAYLEPIRCCETCRAHFTS